VTKVAPSRADAACGVTTTGADADSYSPTGMHAHPFEAFVPVVRQTAQFCGMIWPDPIIVHGAHRLAAAELAGEDARYRARLAALLEGDAPAVEGERRA